MPTTIILRLDKGAPLSPSEADANFRNLRDAIDALAAAQGVALNGDGTLKNSAVTDIAQISPAVLALMQVPVGSLLATAHPTLGTNAGADGFIYADGTSQIRTGNFAALFALIGTVYGPGNAPGSTFALPDLRGKCFIGTSPGSLSGGRDTAYALGGDVASPIGLETVKLVANELAVHTHDILGKKLDDSLASNRSPAWIIVDDDWDSGQSTQTRNTEEAGGSGTEAVAHENRQPSFPTRMVIKL